MSSPSRQRFLKALKGGLPDRVPVFEVNIDEVSIIRVNELIQGRTLNTRASYYGYNRDEAILALYCRLVEELELDATASMYTVGLKTLSEGLVQDKYGVVYRISSHGEAVVVDGPVKDRADLRKLDMVSKMNIEEDCSSAIFLVNHFRRDKAHVFHILDPFKVSWYLRGSMERLLMDYCLEPALAHELARVAVDHGLAAIDMALALEVDVVAVIGDLAGNSSTIMSPDHFRTFIKPYQKALVEYAHKNGLLVIKHSDGNLWPILDELIDVGFDGIHPIQPQCMDIGQVRQRVGNGLCICGNVDCEELLCNGAVEEVEKTVIDTMRTAGEQGAFILTSSNSIHEGVDPRNYCAMVSAAHRYGTYPLSPSE